MKKSKDLYYPKNNRGGKRKGSGRKKKQPTKVMRVPTSLISVIKQLINDNPQQ